MPPRKPAAVCLGCTLAHTCRLAEQLLCARRYEHVVLVDLRPPAGSPISYTAPSASHPPSPAGATQMHTAPQDCAEDVFSQEFTASHIVPCVPGGRSISGPMMPQTRQGSSSPRDSLAPDYGHTPTPQPQFEAVEQAATVTELMSWKERCCFLHGDVTSLADMLQACKGAAAVFHLASYGAPGTCELLACLLRHERCPLPTRATGTSAHILPTPFQPQTHCHMQS